MQKSKNKKLGYSVNLIGFILILRCFILLFLYFYIWMQYKWIDTSYLNENNYKKEQYYNVIGNCMNGMFVSVSVVCMAAGNGKSGEQTQTNRSLSNKPPHVQKSNWISLKWKKKKNSNIFLQLNEMNVNRYYIQM